MTISEILCESIRRFYQEDVATLYSTKYRVECPMAGCVYRYLWQKIEDRQWTNEKEKVHVDTEYARMTNGSGEDSYKEIIAVFEQCNQCVGIKPCSVRKIPLRPPAHNMGKSDNLGKDIRPDIIVHRRRLWGRNNNMLVIEVKHEGSAYDAIKDDHAKLLFLTCPKAGFLQYQLGALVMLRKEYADVGFYSGGKVISGYKVDETGFHKMTEEEYDGKPWLNQKKAKQ